MSPTPGLVPRKAADLDGACLTLLRCPRCRAPYGGSIDGPAIHHLRCTSCGLTCGRRDGILAFDDPQHFSRVELWSRFAYDHFAAMHDLSLKFWLPLAQGGDGEEVMRARFLAQLHLDSLGGPSRVLDIGAGSGGNVRRMAPQLAAGSEIWALDMSAGMLKRLVEWADRPRSGEVAVRALLGDAHALPFADASFDRVIHVGAFNLFRSQSLAVREMVRVAREGARIVIVDEALDPARRHRIWHRFFFHQLTALDPDPHVPLEVLPPEACEVRVDAISRFYYCLSFTRGPSPRFAESSGSELAASGAEPPPALAPDSHRARRHEGRPRT